MTVVCVYDACMLKSMQVLGTQTFYYRVIQEMVTTRWLRQFVTCIIMRELRLRLQLESLETRGLKVQFSCDMCDPIFCFVQIVSYELVSGDTVRVSVRPQGSTVNRYRFSAVSPQRASRVSRDVPNRLPFSCHMSRCHKKN